MLVDREVEGHLLTERGQLRRTLFGWHVNPIKTFSRPASKAVLQCMATIQNSQPHIYAAGDVIGLSSPASTSVEQGRMEHAMRSASMPR